MKGRLKQRQQDILKMLITSTVPLIYRYAEEKLGKSERTIRYDINELKRYAGPAAFRSNTRQKQVSISDRAEDPVFAAV